jgi:hypothetical protein
MGVDDPLLVNPTVAVEVTKIGFKPADVDQALQRIGA